MTHHDEAKKLVAEALDGYEYELGVSAAVESLVTRLLAERDNWKLAQEIMRDGRNNLQIERDGLLADKLAQELGGLSPDPHYRERIELTALIDATGQCAIEAGECSPEGVSTHTMLGDMWDARILKWKSQLAALDAPKGEG